jgi:hypothetical protein
MELVFRMVNRLSLIIAIFLVSALAIFACQLSIYKPSRFDPSEYVFVGEVTGYTESVDFERVNLPWSGILPDESLKRTNGLIVKVSDVVFVPTEQLEFEVFVYGIGSGCESLGRTLERLQNDFPLGTEVIVIAREALEIPKISRNGGKRLEVHFSRDMLEINTAKVTSNSVFDFSKVAPKNEEWLNRYTRGAFEVRKEMLRLEKAADKKETASILRRLLSTDYQADLVDLYGLTTQYSSSVQSGEKLLLDKLVKDGINKSFVLEFLRCSQSEDGKKVPFYSFCPLPPRK